MIKLRVGQDQDGEHPRLRRAGGNNVEAPVDDENRGSQDQERAVGDSGDRDTEQRKSQQRRGDTTDPDSIAKGASGHRSGAPRSADGDQGSNGSADAGNPRGRGAGKDPGPMKRDKDRHGGISLDDEAKARQTDEGGPVNGGAPLRHRHGGSVGQRHHR